MHLQRQTYGESTTLLQILQQHVNLLRFSVDASGSGLPQSGAPAPPPLQDNRFSTTTMTGIKTPAALTDEYHELKPVRPTDRI